MHRQHIYYALIYLSGVVLIAAIGLAIFLWGTSLRSTALSSVAGSMLKLEGADVDQVWLTFDQQNTSLEMTTEQPALLLEQTPSDSQPANVVYSTSLNGCEYDQAKNIHRENGQTQF